MRDTLVITNSEVMPPVEPSRIIEYRVDGGWVKSEQTEVINDQRKLQKIALASVKPYSDLIASMRFDEPWNSSTDKVLGNLFFLTDVSTKRNEFFESFDAFCGAQLIKQKIASRKITAVYVIGTRMFREDTLRSLAPCAQIKLLRTSNKLRRTSGNESILNASSMLATTIDFIASVSSGGSLFYSI